MYIDCDGIKLNAYLDMPKNNPEKCPLCIIIHGFTGHSEERHIVAVQEALNEIGVATLRADMYGHGKSDGKFEDHTLFKWLTNILAVVDYAKNLDFVTDIYMAGHSQGGLSVMLAAAMERDIIKAAGRHARRGTYRAADGRDRWCGSGTPTPTIRPHGSGGRRR